MGRLIDADALIEAMDKRYKEKKDIVPNNLAEGFVQMERLIREQPTAYDVEKVVSKINRCSGNGYRDVDGDYVPPMIETGDAIRIITEGGVED